MGNSKTKRSKTIDISLLDCKCPICNSKQHLGHLNGRSDKVNYFCNNCFVEISFNNKGDVVEASKVFVDGSTLAIIKRKATETKKRAPRNKKKKA